jgi:FKBP-type peptidyl-prolyl cis-trans isomerase
MNFPVPNGTCMQTSNAKLLRILGAFAALYLAASPAFAESPGSTATAPRDAPAGAPSATPPEPVADDASSYSVGVAFGNQLHNSGLEHAVLIDSLIRGLKEGLAGKAATNDDRERSVQLLRVGRDAIAARNRAVAHDFLEKNAAVAGVHTTASGLQYMVFSAGDEKAAAPTVNDRVTVNYRGRLVDGTEFDNSDSHPQAATFGLEGVIKGWHEALLMMKPGAKWRLFVPPALAYDTFSPPAIPPGSLLIFDVELLKVDPRPAMSGSGGSGPPGPKPAAGPRQPAKRAAAPASGQ